MSNVTRTDFSEYCNRCAISQELMKNNNQELAVILIRLLAYMENGNHPDRQTFWEYLENICREKRQGQMVLDQVLTMTQNETLAEGIQNTLDKHLEVK